MKTNLKNIAVAVSFMSVLPSVATAQEKFTVNGEVGIVSDYVWRGADQNSGFSVQPSLTMSYKGFSLNVWGSQTLSKWENGEGAKEIDINLSYNYKNLTVSVIDYWWAGANQPYGDYKNDHFFEGSIAYSFGEKFPLELSWSTFFAGGDKDENGDLMASTYISAAYPISLPADITLTPSVGFTPWEGMYWDKAAFTDITLTASKEIKITDHFSVPFFLQFVAAPVYDRTYFLGGFSIGF